MQEEGLVVLQCDLCCEFGVTLDNLEKVNTKIEITPSTNTTILCVRKLKLMHSNKLLCMECKKECGTDPVV